MFQVNFCDFWVIMHNSVSLGAFAKLRIATISLVISVRLSVWNNSAPTGRIYMKICRKNSSFNKMWPKWRALYMKTDIHFLSLSVLLRMRNFFQAKVVEKIKTQVLRSVTFFLYRKLSLLWDNVEKCCRAGQATADNMAHAHCTLGTKTHARNL